MNKESETLEKLLSFAFVMGENMVGLTKGNYDEKIFIKKTYEYLQKYAISRKERLALQQRLESIDNANPSEALEKLEGIEYVTDVLKVNHKIGSRDIANQEIKEMVDRLNYRIPIIKQALQKAQEQEKVLKILFEKQVDLGWLWYCIHECVNSLNEYNKRMPIDKFKLTQEEFDLVKGMLG